MTTPRRWYHPAGRVFAALLPVVSGTCVPGGAYQRSGMVQDATVGVYATATNFLTARGYTPKSKPTLGPVVVLERMQQERIDRLSLYEVLRTTGTGSPDLLGATPRWYSVKVVVETFELDAGGTLLPVPASLTARAHADSLMDLLTGARDAGGLK